MPTPPAAAGPVRSAAVINAEIRALAKYARWTPEELAELARLREEWAAAVEWEREMGLAA